MAYQVDIEDGHSATFFSCDKISPLLPISTKHLLKSFLLLSCVLIVSACGGGKKDDKGDVTPPETSISSAPTNLTNSTSANFVFASTEEGSTFECALDGEPFASCVSPKSYTGLADGNHTFSVRASDEAGNTDATSATHDWAIDSTPPDTSISSGPASPTNATSASFVFTSTEAGSTFRCTLDGVQAECTSPLNFTGLGAGSHSFSVQATDAAGNTDASPASFDWVINTTADLTPPTVTAPADITVEATSAAGTSASNAAIVAFLAGSSAVDAVDPSPTLTHDAPGTFPLGATIVTFTYTDASGNAGSDTATVTVVDTTPPTVTAPADITVEATSAAGTSASNAAIVAFLAGSSAVDAVDPSPTLTHDAPGTFPLGATIVTFTYTDASGNAGRDTATVTVVDTTPPDTTSIVINNNAQYAVSVSELTARLRASDNVGVTHYLVTEHNATDEFNIVPPYLDPLPSDPRWVPVTETPNLDVTIQFPLTGAYSLGDVVELCAWFMDERANTSDMVCDSIIYGVDWESGIGNWFADNGVWQVGTPSAGPASCFEGTQCAGTELGGNYGQDTDSRLISSRMTLPVVAESEEIHLRFQAWYSYLIGDSGQVQVSVWDPNTSTWGDWVDEGEPVINTSGWSLKDVDITAYSGETVRIGFFHTASRPCCYADGSNWESTGWYIDDIEVMTSTPSFSGDFEAGWTGWGTDRGVWQIGTPTAGPGSCFEGSQCAGTELGGNYGQDTDSRLISSRMTLPVVAESEEIHLRFQNWYSYLIGDSGQVQVSVWNPNTSTWGDWVDEGEPVINTSGWSLKDVDITAYSGETVRIGFFHTASRPCCYADGSNWESTGWYIDDIEVVTSTPSFSGDFEAGWTGWGTDRGVWQIGTPTAGPGSCFEGSQCAGTELGGNYGQDTDSRLIGSTITLPTATGPEEIHLRFQNWYSYLIGDSGQVQVSVWNPNTSTWGDWVDEGEPVINTSGWSLKDVDITAYSGETVRIGFFHTASRPCCYADGSNWESTGWYIDDVTVSVF